MAVVTATGLLYQLLEEETERTGDDAERDRDERVRRGERAHGTVVGRVAGGVRGTRGLRTAGTA